MRVENFIIEGVCSLKGKYVGDDLEKLRESIREFLRRELYVERGSPKGPFLSMRFCLDTSSQEERIKLRSKYAGKREKLQNIVTTKHLERLKELVDDAPYNVFIFSWNEKIEKDDYLFLKIVSEPVILQKKRQLNIEPPTDEYGCSRIVETNKQFIERLVSHMGVNL